MKLRHLTLAISALALSAASFAASADILFQNLGTNAPPATIGGHTMTPFDEAPQNAIAEFTTNIGVIPGSPSGSLSVSPTTTKYTVSGSWGSPPWSGYAGALFLGGSTSMVLTLPANAKAFYVYVQPNRIQETISVTATTDSGATSGAISQANDSSSSGNGYAFYTTAGETISTITISVPESTSGIGVARFGIAFESTTCASSGYTGTKLNWCKIICESESSAYTIDTYLRRWINRYHDLPYCALEEEPQQEG